MADAFSIFATVAGLASLAGTVSKEVYSFVGDVKEAPKGIDSLQAEIDGLSSVLRNLESTLKEDFDGEYPLPPSSAKDLKSVLDNCTGQFEVVQKKLSGYRAGGFLGRLQFVFAEKDIEKLLRSLGAHKQTLNITCVLLLRESVIVRLKKIGEGHIIVEETHDIVERTGSDTLETRRLVERLVEDIRQRNRSPQTFEGETEAVISRYIKRTETLLSSGSTVVDLDSSDEVPAGIENLESPGEIQAGSPLFEEPANIAQDNEGPQVTDHSMHLTENKGIETSLSDRLVVEQQLEIMTGLESIDITDPQNNLEGTTTEIRDTPFEADKKQSEPETSDPPNSLSASLNTNPTASPTPTRVVSKAIAEQSAKALITAAANGNSTMVLLLFDLMSDLNSVNERVGTALQGAVANGHDDIARELLKRGADPNIQGNHPSALSIAIEKDNNEMAKLLLEKGAKATALAGSSWVGTVLNLALRRGNDEMAQLLLKKGADPNNQGNLNAWYPIQTAVAKRNTPAIKYLVAKNANLDNRNIMTGTSLIQAIQTGDEGLVNLLLDLGADRNAAGDRSQGAPLNVALQCDNDRLAQLLLSRGADPNIQGDINAWYPIQTAAFKKNMSAIRYLASAGADLNSRNIMTGTALIQAVEAGDEEVVNLLLDLGADRNAAGDRSQGTALNVALRCDNNRLAQLLLSRGANPNIQGDINACYPIQMAVFKKNMSAIRYLASAGADLNNRNISSLPAISSAIQANDAEILRILIDLGANLDTPGDRSDGTPLNVAARCGNAAFIKTLLAKGADPNTLGDLNALFPLQTAVGRRDKAAVAALLDGGANPNLGVLGGATAFDMAAMSDDPELLMMFLSRTV